MWERLKKLSYGLKPYDGDPRMKDISDDAYAEALLSAYELSGVFSDEKKKNLRILASSVSSGNKEKRFAEKLNAKLATLGKSARIAWIDYAKNIVGRTIMRNPGVHDAVKVYRGVIDAKNINQFPNGTFDVIHERLGGLWHAMDTDEDAPDRKQERQFPRTHTLLEKYFSVLVPGGMLIIDGDCESKMRASTARILCFGERMEPSAENLKRFFGHEGFTVSVQKTDGPNEFYIVTTVK